MKTIVAYLRPRSATGDFRITVGEFNGKLIVGLRNWYKPVDSEVYRSTKEGINCGSRDELRDMIDVLENIHANWNRPNRVKQSPDMKGTN